MSISYFWYNMNILGNTGIEVSKLCFGSLTLTSFQASLSLNEGVRLISHAYDRGVNFLDTAEIYENYDFIKEAFKSIDKYNYVVATKAYAYDNKTAEESLQRALKGIDRDYIDIFLLHEQESEYTLKGHYEALEYLFKAKEKGYIKAIGVSSHFVGCINSVSKYREIEVVHPLLNMEGIGIQDGTAEDMIDALKTLKDKGLGIYSMKALGGGHLISRSKEAINWVKNLGFVDSIAVGMQTLEEVDFNCDLILHDSINNRALEQISHKKRGLVVEDYCRACGNCERRCKQNAIKVVNGKARVGAECILCGYCATVCPDFCIKVV